MNTVCPEPRDRSTADTQLAAVVVDWGTTSFRAFLVDTERRVVAKRRARLGIMQLHDAEFSVVLAQQLAPWIAGHADVHVLMSGMVGSRRGWLEAPYVRTPATLHTLASHLVRLPWNQPNPLYLIPGLDSEEPGDNYEVMRGEEVQVFGALELLRDAPVRTRRFCLPGTHSKWVDVDGETVRRFRTYMTGELFELLSKHSLLGSAMSSHRHDEVTFARGVQAAAQAGDTSLANLIFRARTFWLKGAVGSEQIASWLSGLLIGHELASEMRNAATAQIVFVGEPDLCNHYCAAARLLGVPHANIDAERAGVTCALNLLDLVHPQEPRR